MKKLLKFLLLWPLLFTANAYAANMVSFTDPAKIISVSQSSPIFDVILQSNRTTGYSWALENYDANLIIPVSNAYHTDNNAAKKHMVGVPGYEIWTFKIKASLSTTQQTTKITLVYVRPWEPKQHARTITVTVKVMQ